MTLLHRQTCRLCAKMSPVEATYCMHCGKKLVIRDFRSWPGVKLDIEYENWTNLIDAVQEVFPDIQIPDISRTEISRAFQNLSEANQPILIRCLNLGGEGKRSQTAIGKEVGWSKSTIRSRLGKSLVKIYIRSKITVG